MTTTEPGTYPDLSQLVERANATLDALDEQWQQVAAARKLREAAAKSLDEAASDMANISEDISGVCRSTKEAMGEISAVLAMARQIREETDLSFLKTEVEAFRREASEALAAHRKQTETFGKQVANALDKNVRVLLADQIRKALESKDTRIEHLTAENDALAAKLRSLPARQRKKLGVSG